LLLDTFFLYLNMSELLTSGRIGRIGILDKKRNSNKHIYDRWKNSGLLDGLDKELGIKVSLSFEIAANFLMMEGVMYNIHFKSTGEVYEEDGKYDLVIFPIIRRIVSIFPEAHKYVPEIMIMANTELNTTLWKSIVSGNEKAMIYFYENVLPKWSDYHKKRKHKYYHDFKKEMYEKHLEHFRYGGAKGAKSYEDFSPFDWEAEFCSCVADKIEKIIKEHVKK